MNKAMCPICGVDIKVTEKDRFAPHEKYLPLKGIFVANTICQKSNKKVIRK